jgi:hypothetical protein
MDGHGTSPCGRCEGIPDPSEVSTLGKLSVFLISYNLITRNDINTDLGSYQWELSFWGKMSMMRFDCWRT